MKDVQWPCGTARHIAAGPDAANWDWRVSMASLAKAGPLTPMPGKDRILIVAEGELIALAVDGAEQALEKFRPFRFSGDADTTATLPTGALKCLSLTTRRGAFKGFAAIIELSKKRPHPVFADQFAVLLQGSATVSPALADDGGASSGGSGTDAPGTQATVPEVLGKFDTVVGADDAPEISGRGFLAVLSIDPA
nr:HutD family protein [Arthrobacter stackebrandtii]